MVADTDRAIISWDANVIDTGRVEYGTTSSGDLGTVSDTENTTAHSVEITGLAPGTTYQFRVSNRHAIDDDGLAEATGTFTTPTPTNYSAQIQPPINANGSSVFGARRGVIPVKFTLAQNGSPTCALPPATIAVTRTAGASPGTVNESVYSMAADSGSNFRTDGCQYIYNLNSGALAVGTYRIDIRIDGQVVGSAFFQLN